MTAPTPPTSTLVRPFTVAISDSEIDDVNAGGHADLPAGGHE